MIDVIGHFGSRLSYATVTDQVARGLQERNALGNVMNLDDKFVDPSYAFLPRGMRKKKVLIIADPRDYLIDMAVAEYGRDGVAIFVCPNTTSLSAERVRACEAVGRIYTPSTWCADVIESACESSPRGLYTLISAPIVMPLGVDEPFTRWRLPLELERAPEGHSLISMLHVTTDTFWPGRKGTEELIAAWRELPDDFPARLTIHCLPQLYATIHQELADHRLTDRVKLVGAQEVRGSEPQGLSNLFAQHDMLVAPSRSEGFGIMPLSALVSGMPVLTTAGTGQDQYLGEMVTAGKGKRPRLAGWMQVPTMGVGELTGEDGVAPVVRADQLGYSLRSAVASWSQLLAEVERNRGAYGDWSWHKRREAWVDSLIEWAS